MSQRGVKNQFNITSSHIGHLSVGNKGNTVVNKETKHFGAGATDVNYDISGGNFPQANIGGQATYNNKGTVIGGGGSGGGGLTVKELALGSDRRAEDLVLKIIQSGIGAVDLKTILKNGMSLQQIEKALSSCRNQAAMVQIMLRKDAMVADDTDSD